MVICKHGQLGRDQKITVLKILLDNEQGMTS